ncbi:MAG: RNA methyltransferase [Cyclobacteriaceae bacterium]|jgi:23S rRNA (guanosine2251-2'-O)-methyltransferase|nr:RNA methyltransferase [Cyclobacteriaceae bacterium]MDH4297840.1 RNA methyltransferase [Cyclobacteriaceae bacterium]MDH5247407.1 RNA methyltransferase [Cyclobacteriaceae bacterium]
MKKLRLAELGRITIDEFKEAKKLPICIMLDNVRSLHNVGSAFRTADAFTIEKIFLVGITGKPPHREIQKTALGATDSVNWEYAENPQNVVALLRAQGYKIVIVEQTTESIPLHTFQPSPSGKYCLVFGNEVNGVSESLVKECDVALEIPQAGTKHSLNISVCVGIIIWELFKKMRLGAMIE